MSPHGHSTYPCESEEWKDALSSEGHNATKGYGLQAREGCILTASIPPSFGLETSRNGRLEGNSPFAFRMLCVQRTDKMHEPQRNVQRLMILTPL